jgi:Tn3 transposase DDE domain
MHAYFGGGCVRKHATLAEKWQDRRLLFGPFILHNQRLCGVTISKVLLKESACVFCGLSINSILTPGCAEQYVDTHGQSEVGFAFCYLLGFALLPRLKNIKKQRLYRPQRGELEK